MRPVDSLTTESEEREGTTPPLTRIFITAQGDIVVTDLWDEVRPLLADCRGGEE